MRFFFRILRTDLGKKLLYNFDWNYCSSFWARLANSTVNLFIRSSCNNLIGRLIEYIGG